MPTPHRLQITALAADAVLSTAHKRFNKLIAQIGQARSTLQAWHSNVALYQQSHVDVLLPLQAAFSALQRRWAFAVDALLCQPGWSRADSASLREMLFEALDELIDDDDVDTELKALFDKHSEVDFDTERQQSALARKAMAEALTGPDLGEDEGIAGDADLRQRMQDAMAAGAGVTDNDGESDDTAAANPHAAWTQRPGAAKRETAAARRRAAESQLATQSVREIYRRLASSLHPDREPDPAQRAAKTALMQQVNQAYAASDLLTLLELQLQIEQVDAQHVAAASPQRLKHYNQVLAEQLDELRAELGRIEMGFRIDFGLGPGPTLNPDKLMPLIAQHKRGLLADTAMLESELRLFGDRTRTRAWLKRRRAERRLNPFEDFS